MPALKILLTIDPELSRVSSLDLEGGNSSITSKGQGILRLKPETDPSEFLAEVEEEVSLQDFQFSKYVTSRNESQFEDHQGTVVIKISNIDKRVEEGALSQILLDICPIMSMTVNFNSKKRE